MEEQVFFQYEGVRVTNTRFIVDGQTFAMNNITSVKPMEKKPSRFWPILLIVLGVIPAFNGTYEPLIFVAAGIAWFVSQKTVYHVMLHTAGGETSALKTFQREYLDKVVTALNNAIIHRG